MKCIPKINEHAQDYSCPGATLRSVHMGKCYLSKCTMGNLPLEVSLGKRKTHVNSIVTGVRP